ncbi:MAG TPA: hypothetical protein VN704_04120 [Verrucomicrobiae bacterium]|nr:hypothetical protein [Verrucomicrobiae bacterium]
MPKRFVLLFPFAAFLAIIISSYTLSSVSGLTPASDNYSFTFSSPASNSSCLLHEMKLTMPSHHRLK